jgi:hypothetical protein
MKASTINIWLLTEPTVSAHISLDCNAAAADNSGLVGHPNGLISGHLAVNVIPQKTHSIVLKKKIATRY